MAIVLPEPRIADYFYTEDNVRILYKIYGTGKETIVLLHGWGGAQTSFLTVIANIDLEKYTVVTYDHRGFGGSGITSIGVNRKILAKDLHDLLKYLDLKDVTLVGWSMGGLVSFTYFEIFKKEFIKKFVCVDCTPQAVSKDDRHLGFYNGTYDYKAVMDDLDIILNNFNQMAIDLAEKADMVIYTEEMKKVFVERVISQNKDTKFACLCMWIEAMMADDENRMSNIDVPVLFFHGERSTYCSMKAANAAVNAFKNSRMVEMKDCTHFLPLEKPKEFAEELCKFITE